ncbi:MAG: hypothetical protein K6G89_05380 [Clostridia bacterium]|nr:hypothetical protein [Clostridia bacterium]
MKALNHSEAEYNTLRDEMNLRIGAIYNQSAAAISSILTALASAIALLVISFNVSTISDGLIIGFDIAEAVLLLMPLLFLLPLSIKSGENLQQITSISCYIRVFFEFNPNSKEVYSWETANNSLSSINVKRRKLPSFINSEYAFLAIGIILVEIAFAFLNYLRMSNANNILMHIFHGLALIVSIVITIVIARTTSIYHRLQKPAKMYTIGYIMYGKKYDNFPEELDVKEVWQQFEDQKDHVKRETDGFLSTIEK